MYLRHHLVRVCRKFFCGQNVQRVDDAWNPTKDGQQDVDEQIAATSALKEDTQWWQKDGEDDLANVAAKHTVSKGLTGRSFRAMRIDCFAEKRDRKAKKLC
jgi:hypothetical protein